jgi:hypothetical protein
MYPTEYMFLPHLNMETDPVSEMLCSLVCLEYQMTDEVQKPRYIVHYNLLFTFPITGKLLTMGYCSQPLRKNLVKKLKGYLRGETCFRIQFPEN